MVAHVLAYFSPLPWSVLLVQPALLALDGLTADKEPFGSVRLLVADIAVKPSNAASCLNLNID